jgi:hypothetical protein
MSDPAFSLEHGNKFPYDAPDGWWDGPDASPPPATDWAHAAARGILGDLTDRHTIKWSFDNIDEETRAEIVQSLAAIIRLAALSGAVRALPDSRKAE